MNGLNLFGNEFLWDQALPDENWDAKYHLNRYITHPEKIYLVKTQ